jgi:uncharacterized protein YegP (UPF0339 family)
MPTPSTAPRTGKFLIHRKPGKQPFRWSVKGANGEPLANGGESYHNEKDCRHGAERTARILASVVGYRVVKAHASRARRPAAPSKVVKSATSRTTRPRKAVGGRKK